MDRSLGLSRDPFAPSADGILFWENEARTELRGEVLALLEQGSSVWLCGPSGCGRRTLLGRVAEDLAARGIPTAVAGPDGENSAVGFLFSLASVVGDAPVPGTGLLPLAATVYERLVEVFCEARPAVLVLPWEMPEAVAEETAILAGLRLLGHPLTAVAALGSGEPPTSDFSVLHMPAVTTEDLRECLLHRCAAAGRVDLLSPAELDRVISGASNLGEVVARAQAELRRRRFAAGLNGEIEPPDAPTTPVLNPSQVQEVGELLRSLDTASDHP